MNTLIDRIRHDIQERLEQLQDEAKKLGGALAALDARGEPRPRPAGRSSRRSAATSRPRSTPSVKHTSQTGKREVATRTAPGATKRTVLGALLANRAMTAGEVAAATGLARPTVSTTLSKLAKSGEITKADRGYRLPEARGASASP